MDLVADALEVHIDDETAITGLTLHVAERKPRAGRTTDRVPQMSIRRHPGQMQEVSVLHDLRIHRCRKLRIERIDIGTSVHRNAVLHDGRGKPVAHDRMYVRLSRGEQGGSGN